MYEATHSPVLDDRGTLPPSDIAAFSFLARYSGNTAKNYETVLRIYFTWLRNRGVDPLAAHRAHIEAWGRSLEDGGRMPSTVDHYLGIIIGFYKFAEIDEYVNRSPATYVRRPKFDRDETRRLGLDRLELGSMIATAKALGPCEGAAILLMGNLGLRNSEACAVRIEDYAETLRGHRVLRVVGKGNKAASIPLPVPLLRALDNAAAGRTTGRLLVRTWDNDSPLNGVAMRRLVARVASRAKIGRRVLPHELRHAMITNALDAGVPLRDVQIAARHADPRLTARYDRNRHNLDRHAVHTLSAYLAGAA
ncbi:MAG: tyrosine-type recombinase/integrase [Aeromicrobium sp.]|uniref:tyrosine-type recombinase/integrase n=1 Tax=Aeromicrobium sp. TaxID=1871063 RepID=UPI00260213B4|nr:tyrosine-type recombinase/integrase [Aeromicrobium sp.]MDF1704997.1 tyrosine-type recombinase/integrase [Aeromicrobium sp.]